MKILKFCSGELKKYKKLIVMFYLLIILFSVISLYITYFTGTFIDYLTERNSFKEIVIKCLFFGILCILCTIISLIQNIISTILNSKISFNLCKNVIVHLHNADILSIINEDSVSLAEKVTNDTSTLTSFCINSIQNVFTNILYILGSSIFLIIVDIRMSLLIFLVLFFYLLLFKLFNNKLYDVTLKYQEVNATYISEINNQIKYIRNIKINNRYSYFLNKLKREFQNLYQKIMSFQWIMTIFNSLDTIVMRLAQVIIFLFGGYELLNGNITVGIVVVLVNYFNNVLNALRYFLNLGKIYQESKVSLDRIQKYLNYDLEYNSTVIVESIETIKLNNVSFAYQSNTNIIKDFCYIFTRGNVYGIKGENGKGKTTLVNLIIGLYINHYSGFLFINDIDIHKLNLKSLRKNKISFLEQDDILLNETIKNNIFENKVIKNDKYYKLLKVLNISDFIDNNIDKVISDIYANISGGQKKKISLLRVLLKDFDLLILDEPTAALDDNTCKNLYNYIDEIKKDKIIILISHDDKFEKICDDIIYL